MKYVFFGSPDFAAGVLEKLIAGGFVPAVVVTNPDRPRGRKQIVTPPPVKLLIANDKWPVTILQPEKIDSDFMKMLSDLQPDYFIVAAYAKILPKELISIPRLGTIGVHPSLLPKYRGASPIQSAILDGAAETGTALFMIDEKVDHGPVLAQEKLENYDMSRADFISLKSALAALSGEVLLKTLPKFLSGELAPAPQSESDATYTKKFTAEDGFVTEENLKSAMENSPEKAILIDRKVRALGVEPGVWTLRDGKRIKLLKTELQNKLLTIKEFQIEGKKSELSSGNFPK